MAGQGLSANERVILVNAAILAPSMHNTQPWLFRFSGRTVEVYRDPRRALGAEDPDNRMAMIGVGAAVLNLRVAAASLGRRTSTVLLPDPHRPTLAAEVTVGPEADGDEKLAALFPAIPRRRMNRQPFENRPVPADVREELSRAAEKEGAELEWVEKLHRLRWLRQLAADAEFAEADDPRRLEERRLWVGGERGDEGIPSASLGPRSTTPLSPVRDLAVDPRDRLRGQATYEETISFAVLSTPNDTPADFLRAGQALERVLLVATVHGLAASLLNQPLEHKELRWLVRDPLSKWSASQAVLRIGYGPEVPPTPRRPVESFLLGPDESPPVEAGPAASA